MSGIVILIPADEREPIRSRETDKQPALQELQATVGGHIEAVPFWNDYMGKPCVVYCNEDGVRMQLPPNKRANALWYHQPISPPFTRASDFLVGDVVIVVNLPDEEEQS